MRRVSSGCLAVALCAWLSAGCHCPAGVPDAGARIERASDLHTALQLVFPEYRGTRVLQTTATLTRRVEPAAPGDLEKARALAAANGFTGDPLTHAPFTLTLEQQGSALVLTLTLPIKEDEIGRIFSAPASMSSETMARWLPALAAPTVRETFTFELEWQAVRPARASFLNWQLVDGALRSGWVAEGLPPGYSTDAGSAGVPDPFKVSLTEPSTTGRIDLERAGDRATVRYTLVTR